MDSDKTSLASTLQSFLNSQPLLCTDLEHSTYPEIIAPSIFEENFLFNSVYYISDIHLDNHILQQSTLTPTQYTEKVIDGLFTDNFINSINMPYPPIVLFGGDIASTFETAKLFYTEFVSRISQVKLRNFANLPYIYAILGNHELWDFPNLKDCYTAYQALFDSLNIHFLHNTTSPFGHHYHLPSAKSASSTTNSKRMPTDTIHSTIIVGGIGFAGHNETYNADCGLYRSTLNRCQEIKETQKWCKSYSKALTLAHNTGSRLIVLTHNPIVDWKDNSQPDPNCIYFNGHTHKNNLMHDEKLDIHIFADNQIGYQNPNISFKIAQIYKRCNPFSTYIDGYYEISVSDYLRFYDYIGELISGIRTIENYMKNGANFYMIKRNDYYGFFVISSKANIA